VSSRIGDDRREEGGDDVEERGGEAKSRAVAGDSGGLREFLNKSKK